jgi:hypothetical protein
LDLFEDTMKLRLIDHSPGQNRRARGSFQAHRLEQVRESGAELASHD